jgi:hypothetical protein
MLVLGEPEERGGLPGDLRQAWIRRYDFAEAFEVADGCQFGRRGYGAQESIMRGYSR